jgi:ubiquinone/menaquinone biosynthesis C-methylase UbiE
MTYYKIFSGFYRFAAQKMCEECSPFISKKSKILDLGCGSGIVANEFKKCFNVETSGVDIIDKRVVGIPFSLYDGKNLPLPDNSFDAVLISYVLHHCEDPVAVLKEAKRVARKKIILYEDAADGLIPKVVCKFHGMAFAKFFQKNDECGNFKTSGDWKDVFDKLGLELIFEKKVLKVLNHKMFVLRKN